MEREAQVWSELKTLFWLQWKLTRAMFRSGRLSDRLRLLEMLWRVSQFLFTFPVFLLLGVGLAVGLILFSADAAYELVMIVNTGLCFLWLVLPASISSQMVERFEMSRLFLYPISFRSIVVGSTLMSLLTMTGLWTVPILLGEIVGLAWHQPLALPLIALGALPTFGLLVLTGRIMDDLFDLVAGDRRLRTLALSILSLPFMLCWLGQYAIQYLTDDYSNLPQIPFLEGLARLEEASGPVEVLEILRLSRLLTWLPPGWTTAGMGLSVRGEWGPALLFLGLSTSFVVLLLWGHAGITRRLMQGAVLSIGAERVRSRRWGLRLPGPPAFWALFHKDWLYLWRSPLPRRLLFSSVIVIVAMVFPMRGFAQSNLPPPVRAAIPLMVGAFVITMINLAVNMGLTANYFGSVDREGLATLAFSGLDRRYVILSANLAALLFAGLQVLLAALGLALLTGLWVVFPLGLYLGLCMQVGSTPAYNLAAIIGPYRAQLQFGQGRQRGNMWGFLAWGLSALPILALIVLPYIFWKPGLLLTLPLGVVCSLGLYVLTLKPLARLLQRREYVILEAVTTGD
jgi:hypothetical protein